MGISVSGWYSGIHFTAEWEYTFFAERSRNRRYEPRVLARLDAVSGPTKRNYVRLLSDAQESEEIDVVGVGGKLLLGGCCKIIKPGLRCRPPTVIAARSVPPDTSLVGHLTAVSDTMVSASMTVSVGPEEMTEVLNSTSTRDRGFLPRSAGFFCKKSVDKKDLLRKVKASEHVAQAEKEVAEAVEDIDPHKEAQELVKRLRRSRPIFEVDVHPQPSFEDFSDSLLSAVENNVRVLLFSGHDQSHCGFL